MLQWASFSPQIRIKGNNIESHLKKLIGPLRRALFYRD